MKGAALLPPHDVSLAVREARRAVKELGFVSAFMRATPLPGRHLVQHVLGAPVGGAGGTSVVSHK